MITIHEKKTQDGFIVYTWEIRANHTLYVSGKDYPSRLDATLAAGKHAIALGLY